MKLPIRARVTLWYLLLLAVLVSALGVFVVTRLRADLVNGVDATLATRAQQISLGFAGKGEGEFQDVSDSSLAGLPGSESAAQLLDAKASVLETSGDPAAVASLLSPSDVTRVLSGETISRSITLGKDAESFRILAVALPGSAPRVIVAATSLDTVDASVHHLSVLLLLAGPTLLLIASLGGWWVAGAALAPVRRITRTSAYIGMEHLDERVDVPGTTDEIHDLALTMNSMLERLEQGVADQRRFIADASHELRTPIAIMRSEVEVSLLGPDLGSEARTTLESVRQELEDMGSSVENLLTLARADEGQLSLAREHFDLRGAAEAVRDGLSHVSAAGGVAIEVEGESAQVFADRSRIDQVLRNLLSNAIRYSGRGSHVTITTDTEDGAVRCTVVDDGPGIPPESLPHVFDRFFRGAPSRSGTGAGLGLAICHEIVAAHGGQVRAESGPDGGSTFTFTIPAAGEGTPR